MAGTTLLDLLKSPNVEHKKAGINLWSLGDGSGNQLSNF